MSMGTLASAARQVEGRLVGEDRPYEAVCTDTRQLRAGELFVALRGPNFCGREFLADARQRGAAGALVESLSDCGLAQVQVDDTCAALGNLAHHWRSQYRLPLVALTGSNGKTTVKEMLAAILRHNGDTLATAGNFNNQVGVPLTLLRLRSRHRAAVIELGANHPGEIACLSRLAAPGIGVITNAATAHLEGFGSIEGVARAKGELLTGLPADGIAVINADDRFAGLWRELAGERIIISFGLTPEARFSASDIRQSLQGEGAVLEFRLRSPLGEHGVKLPLPGKHNVANALAAAAAAWAAGADAAAIVAGLEQTRGVSGRLQLHTTPCGARLIDDTYNANPTSLRSALKFLTGLDGSAWLVLGDMAELGDEAAALHGEMGALARELGVERMYTIGPLSALAAERFGSEGRSFADTAALIRKLREELQAGVNLLVKGSRSMRMERVAQALAGAADTSAQLCAGN